MNTLVLEGWRFIAHSFAMVNQHLCLELLRRPDVRLYHRDAPYFVPAWRPGRALWSPAEEAALRSIPPPPPGLRADAVIRLRCPYDFERDPQARRTFIWGTTESKRVEEVSVGARLPVRELLPRIECDVIAPSRWAAAGFAVSGTPTQNIHVVPCGVDPRVFQPPTPDQRTALRARLGWENRFVVLNISAMCNSKGIDLLLRSALSIADQVPNLLIALKGSDALFASRSEVDRELAHLSPGEAERLRGLITYSGHTLTTLEIADLYRAADAYVCPYRAEGFNLPALEAMACGLPLVCTRGGATDDFVSDDFALLVDSIEEATLDGGIVLTPRTDRLTECMLRVASDAAWREAAAQEASRHARDRFSWARCVDRLLQVVLGR